MTWNTLLSAQRDPGSVYGKTVGGLSRRRALGAFGAVVVAASLLMDVVRGDGLLVPGTIILASSLADSPDPLLPL